MGRAIAHHSTTFTFCLFLFILVISFHSNLAGEAPDQTFNTKSSYSACANKLIADNDTVFVQAARHTLARSAFNNNSLGDLDRIAADFVAIPLAESTKLDSHAENLYLLQQTLTLHTNSEVQTGAPLPWPVIREKNFVLSVAAYYCVALALFIVSLCIFSVCAYNSYWLTRATMQHFQPRPETSNCLPDSPQGLLQSAADEWTKTSLPVICPRFVQANANKSLLLPIEQLDAANWCVEVYGFLQFVAEGLLQKGFVLEPTLCISSRFVAEGYRVVEVSNRGDGAMVLATVSSFLELRGTSGKWLGRFELGDDGTCLLREASGRPVVSVRHDANHVGFHITSLFDGSPVAAITQSEGSKTLPLKHFEIMVTPGVDIVLVITCLLATILFKPQVPCPHVQPGGVADSL